MTTFLQCATKDPLSLIWTSSNSSATTNCTRSYKRYGHSETRFEVLGPIDRGEEGSEENKAGEVNKWDLAKEYRYSPYMDTLPGGYGPKVSPNLHSHLNFADSLLAQDLVPVYPPRGCRGMASKEKPSSQPADGSEETARVLGGEVDSEAEGDEQYLEIDWEISFSGRTPAKAKYGNGPQVMAELSREHGNMTEEEFESNRDITQAQIEFLRKLPLGRLIWVYRMLI